MAQEARSWTGNGTTSTTTGNTNGKKDASQLDRSATPGEALQGGENVTPLDLGVSLVDADDDLDEDVYSDDEAVAVSSILFVYFGRSRTSLAHCAK